MKISTTQEKLARALNAASRIANARSGLPILGNILLRTDGKQLYIAATDLELALTERVTAKVDKPGSITAPAKLISDFISNLPKDTVTIEVNNSKIIINSANYTSTINGVVDDDFPELPRVEDNDAVRFSLSVDDFKEAAGQTIVAASNDTTRPVLTGVYMHTFEGGLYFAATDGYRLAEKYIVDVKSDIAAIIPVSTIQEVIRLINEETDQIDILLNDTQVTFIVGAAEVTSRLIDGNYPDYRQLIPSSNTTTCEVSVSDLKRVVKLAALFSKNSSGGIRITVNSETNELGINSIASELGENMSTLSVSVVGESGDITLNSRYINDILSVISDDRIMFGFSTKLAPSVITSIKDTANYKHIIMPIKS